MDESCEKEKELDIEEVVILMGEFGIFQRLLDGVFCLLSIPMGYQIIITALMGINPPWECAPNSKICNFTGIFHSDDNRRCKISREEWQFTEPKVYSIVTQFDIYCDKEWVLHLNSSILFAGWGIGAFCMGWIGNKYGRKIVLFPSVTTILFVGLLSAFSPNLFLVIVSRFIIGFCIPGTMYCMFLLISELVSNKQRPIAGLLIWVTLPLAFSILAIKAYLLQNWKKLSIFCTAPYIPLLAFYKFVPESFKWQMLQGRMEEAMFTVQRIARWNGKQLPDNIVIAKPTDTDSQCNPFDIFTQSNEIAINSVLLAIMWLVLGIVYYGLYFAADELGGSVFHDLFVLSIGELPTAFLSIYICEQSGRKPAVLAPLLVGVITCFSLGFLPRSLKSAKIVLGMFGKFFISISFNSLTTWSVESFPVNICSGGMGFMQIACMIGSASAPWVAKFLRIINKRLPFIVMAISALIGFISGMWLPETRKKKTVTTVEKFKLFCHHVNTIEKEKTLSFRIK